MDHLHQEMDLDPNDVVEVTLNRPAKVMLLDPSNYLVYQQKRICRYHGGYVTKSPFRIRAPYPGKWHLVVDLGGGPGAVRASVTVISGAMAS